MKEEWQREEEGVRKKGGKGGDEIRGWAGRRV